MKDGEREGNREGKGGKGRERGEVLRYRYRGGKKQAEKKGKGRRKGGKD